MSLITSGFAAKTSFKIIIYYDILHFCMILTPLIHKTIPSLVADKGGYHPYLLMWELTWFFKLILADASKPHVHVGGNCFIKRVTGKK